MTKKSHLKPFSISFFVSLSVSVIASYNFDQSEPNFEFDQNGLVIDSIKEIISVEKMSNILILGRSEDFLKMDIAFIANDTTMKIYKRIEGWKYFSSVVQHRGMSCIVVFKRYHEMEEYFRQFHTHQNFNSRTHFIIVPLYIPSKRDINHLGQILSFYRIVNYVLLIKEQKSQTILIITNLPYENNMCGNFSEKNDAIIAHFHRNQGLTYLREKPNSHDFHIEIHHTNLYPPKVPRNLHKCVIRIVTGLWPPNVIDVDRTIFPGIEIEFVRVIARYMNFIPKFLYLNDIVGEKLPNGSWTGFMGYLERNQADMSIGAVHVDPSRVFVFDISDWYIYNFMLWIVPKMRPPPKSAILEHFLVDSSALGKFVFISVFFTTAIAILIAARVVKAKDTFKYSQVGYIILRLIQMFLSQSLNRLPRTVQVRWIFALWLSFCTCIIFFFQTSITSYFMSPGKPRQIHDIQEAFDMNLRITYDTFYDQFVRNASRNFQVTKRNEKLPVIPSLHLVSKGEAVTFIDRLRAIYITKQWLREDGSIPIKLLQNNPVHRYWVQVVMTKGHYLSPWINEMVGRAWNNGFWLFMEHQYIERRTIQCSVRRQIILNNNIQHLNNTDAVTRYNDAIYEAFPKGAVNQQVNEIFAPTSSTENELLDMFLVSTDTSITFGNLQALFELYLLGMSLSVLAFVCEIITFKAKERLHDKRNKRRNKQF